MARSCGSRTSPRSSWALRTTTSTRTSTAIPRRPSSSSRLPGTNAAAVIEEVKEKLEEIKEESFPPGMDFEVSYDVSSFLEASIEKVLHTLFEAFVLVSLVVYLFLGDWRSTLIPTLAVPVSLIGTFFFMQLFGLSINLITLFALVLAIGVVVDDAIVVVEAVHAKMHEKHLSPYRATKEVDQRDQRRDHRHHPGDDGGLRSGDLHDRAGRHLLPPVRHHDGHVHRSLRRRGPDAHAGALCDDSQAPHGPREKAWAAGLCCCIFSTVASRRSRAVMPRSCAGSSRAAC